MHSCLQCICRCCTERTMRMRPATRFHTSLHLHQQQQHYGQKRNYSSAKLSWSSTHTNRRHSVARNSALHISEPRSSGDDSLSSSTSSPSSSSRWSRGKSTLDRMRSAWLSRRIPFRFPSSLTAEPSLVSIPAVVKSVFNPSLISKMSDLPFAAQLVQTWRRILYKLLPLGGSSHGNRVTVYADGDDAFEAMWDAIASAKHSICMETYILEPDAVGIKTMQLLADAAKRGVAVTLIYDSVGSSKLLTDWKHIQALSDSGAEVVQFNPILSFPWRRRFLFRNHRKILIVDDTIGFTGGMNIGKEYCGLRLGGNGQFRDTQIKVVGPAVLDLLKVFSDSYSEALPNNPVPVYKSKPQYQNVVVERKLQQAGERRAKLEGRVTDKAREIMRKVGQASLPPLHEPALIHTESNTTTTSSDLAQEEKTNTQQKMSSEPTTTSLSASSSFSPSPPSPPPSPPPSASSSASASPLLQAWPAPPVEDEHNLFVQVLKSNVWRNSRLIQRAMNITLSLAKRYAYITTPYFTPPPGLRRAMTDAAQRGVDVRILMSGAHNDVPWSRWASIHIYHLLLRKRVRIYELGGGRMLHGKTVTIDGVYSSIGSFNFDRMSMLNLEVNITILDPDIANQLETHFFADLLHSREVTLQELQHRTWWQKILHWICYQLALLIRP